MLFCSFQTSANTSHCFVILIKFAPSSIIRVWTYDQFSQSIGCDHKSNTYIFGKYDKYLSKRSESSQTIHFWPFMDQSRIIIRSGTPFCRNLIIGSLIWTTNLIINYSFKSKTLEWHPSMNISCSFIISIYDQPSLQNASIF